MLVRRETDSALAPNEEPSATAHPTWSQSFGHGTPPELIREKKNHCLNLIFIFTICECDDAQTLSAHKKGIWNFTLMKWSTEGRMQRSPHPHPPALLMNNPYIATAILRPHQKRHVNNMRWRMKTPQKCYNKKQFITNKKTPSALQQGACCDLWSFHPKYCNKGGDDLLSPYHSSNTLAMATMKHEENEGPAKRLAPALHG